MSKELEVSFLCYAAECIVRHEPWDKAGKVISSSTCLRDGFRTLRRSAQVPPRERKSRVTIASAAGRRTLTTARFSFVTLDLSDAASYTARL